MWEVAFFVDDQGRQPARAWLSALGSERRAAAIAAVETRLMELGPAVVGAGMGHDHGEGLLEFEVWHEQGRLRIFFHVSGETVVLLSGAEEDSDGRESPPRPLEFAGEQLRSLKLWGERDDLGRRRRG